jgi:ABC-2 type transport system permease protein
MKKMIIRTIAMAHKEVVHILRDPQILAFALGMPVLLILLFGYAVSFDVDHIPLVVIDQDHTQSSRELASEFYSSRTFEVVAERSEATEAEKLFRSNAARVALVIPRGFARKLSRGETAEAQLLLDGADNTTASIALGYARAVSLAASRENLEDVLGELEPPLSVRARVFFNPALRSAVFLVPGLIVVILVMIAVMITALTVAREYEQGSMEQLFATPVGRLEVILGKLLPYFVIGLVQVLLVLTVGVMLFDVPINGSVPLLFALSSVFLLAALMQGLFISVITRHQMVASQVAAISTFLPALLLSGFIFPIENMPIALQALTAILPPQYFVRPLRAILLRGNGISVIWPDLLALFGFFVIFVLLAVARFERRVG